jgi:hypothetical protein
MSARRDDAERSDEEKRRKIVKSATMHSEAMRRSGANEFASATMRSEAMRRSGAYE